MQASDLQVANGMVDAYGSLCFRIQDRYKHALTQACIYIYVYVYVVDVYAPSSTRQDIYLPPIYLSTYLPIYLSTYLPIYLPTYLPIYLSIYLHICKHTTCIHTYIPMHRQTGRQRDRQSHLPTCIPHTSHLRVLIHAHIPTCGIRAQGCA